MIFQINNYLHLHRQKNRQINYMNLESYIFSFDVPSGVRFEGVSVYTNLKPISLCQSI